jgi:putative hydrolase of the HAD superfamily
LSIVIARLFPSQIDPSVVIPGRAQHEPGIHNHDSGLWIPGLRQVAHPQVRNRAPGNDDDASIEAGSFTQPPHRVSCFRPPIRDPRGMMIEAVIFDFGGVLTSSPFEAFSRFERERGLPADIIRRTNAANHWENAWAKFERAEIDLETFDGLFAAESLALGAEVRGKDVVSLLSGDLRPEMVAALKTIKATLKTGCITNNLPANAIGSAAGRMLYIAEIMALFDHVIESAKIGLRKPDPRIYRMMTEALGVDPKACVYLDDLGVNLKPARDMGMTTIKVASGPQAIAELEKATGLSLRVPTI